MDKSNIGDKSKIEFKISSRNFDYLILATLFIFAFMQARATKLQIFERYKFSSAAAQNKTREVSEIFPRGLIYDRFLNPLVENVPSFNLLVDSRAFGSKRSKQNSLDFISSYVGEEKLKEILKALEVNPKIIVKEGLGVDEFLELGEKIKDLEGIFLQEFPKRHYLATPFMSHVIGFTGIDKDPEVRIGKSGVEKIYDTFLRSLNSKKVFEVDSRSKYIKELAQQEGKMGNNIVLSIDRDFQEKLFLELEKTTKKLGSKKAAAVAIDPRDGKVRALVNIPAFDNNIFSAGVSQEDLEKFERDEVFLNRAVQGEYPIGSSIKPFIAVAGLEEKVITPGFVVEDKGVITVPHKYNPGIIYTFRSFRPLGLVDLQKAIALSSNIYFYITGGGYGSREGLGPDRIKKYLEIFNFGKKTEIDIEGESIGFVPDPNWKKKKINEDWYIGDTYNLSIGQGFFKATPLQLALATASLANGGKLFRPQIVDKIVDRDQNVIKHFDAELLLDLPFRKENISNVRRAMRETVISGSARLMAEMPIAFAGKTGSAEFANGKDSHAWFTVFGPYENPEILLTILIEEGGIGGNTIRLAKNVLEWYFNRK